MTQRNHVTDDMERRRVTSRVEQPSEIPPPPYINPELVAWLETVYPARCLDYPNETVEAHLLYAGAVNLVAAIRSECEEQQAEKMEPVQAPDPTADATDGEVFLDLPQE